jgi:lipopolysaccharide transport system permease protein
MGNQPRKVCENMSLLEAQGRPVPPEEPVRPQPLLIEPSKGWVALRLGDLWEYRELLYFLVWRDVKVRYKQTLLGASWAILQPFLMMVVFSFIFGTLVQVPTEGAIPYPIFTFVALLPWQFFANALSQSANSLVNSAALLRKVYFPRLAVPIASALAGLVDFGFAFLVLIGLMVYFQIVPTLAVLLLPLFLLLALVTVLGVGLWLSALNVQYRDVRYIVPFLVQIWMYASPVVYPSSLLDEPWRTLYGLNPMVGVIEGFRWALLGTSPPGAMIGVSTLVAMTLFISGLFYFRRMEQTFADAV